MWPWIVLLVPQKWLVATISGLIVVGVLTTITFAAMFPDNKFVSTLPFAAWDALGGGALLATFGVNTSSCRKFARWALLVGLPVWFFLGAVRNSLPLSISGACIRQWCMSAFGLCGQSLSVVRQGLGVFSEADR